MSFRRKKYDADFPGGGTGTAEWRNSLGDEGQTGKYASSKRTGKNPGFIDSEDELFREEGDKDRYLITYADLITLLLGLFIILYAISNVDTQKYAKLMSAMGHVFGVNGKAENLLKTDGGQFSIKDKIMPPGNLKKDLQNMIDEKGFNNSIKLEENERGITIHILDEILFPSATADLNDGSKDILRRIAALIKPLKNDIRVEGHTDNIPINSSAYPSNWHLSVSRALNTAYYLIDQEGLSPDKVSIVGYSEYRPVSSNITAEGRRSNRRVDIVILKK